MFAMKSVLTLVTLFASVCLALTDRYSIENNKVLQTCAYVSNSDTFLQSFFRSKEPYIKILLPKEDNPDEKVEVYTLIMGGEDMTKVTIGLNPYYKVCDEYALAGGFCQHESDESHSKKLSLPDLIDANTFSYPIESFMLGSSDEGHVYNLEKSSIYCIMFLTSTIPEGRENLTVEVEWVQSFGKLLVSDFNRLFTSLYLALAYTAVGVYLFVSIYLKVQNDKTSISLDSLKYKKYTLQYKFLIYHLGMAFLYMVTMVHYLVLNNYGYNTSSIVVPLSNLISLSLTTLLTVWLIYNLMLFSAGAWFGGLKNSSLKLYVARFFALVLVFEMLVYDVETSSIYSLIGDTPIDFLSIIIYIEFIIIFVLCIAWAILTSFSIKDSKLKNSFYVTIALLTIAFSTVIFGAYIFSATAQASAVAYIIEFIFAVIVTLIWNNVVIENYEIVLKGWSAEAIIFATMVTRPKHSGRIELGLRTLRRSAQACHVV